MKPPRSTTTTGPAAQRGGAWPWLLLLLLVVGAGAGGWYSWPWVRAQYEQVQGERGMLKSMSTDVAALKQQARKLAEEQSKLGARLEGDELRLGDMAQSLDSGRIGLQLAAIEQLLLVANDQLSLANDARTARRALDEADRRLARLDNPVLLPVREALARERSALAAMPDLDRAGTALALGELIRKAPQWALRARSAERYTAQVEGRQIEPAEGWVGRIWASVSNALAGMFTVRRSQGPAPRLLPPGEEALVAQALLLKLEGARLATLAGDVASVRDLCASAGEWLQEYYNEADPAVAGARRQLAELVKASNPVAPPDITGSLAKLRQFMDQRLAR